MTAGAGRLGHLAWCWEGGGVGRGGGQGQSAGLGHKLMKVSNLDTPVN